MLPSTRRPLAARRGAPLMVGAAVVSVTVAASLLGLLPALLGVTLGLAVLVGGTLLLRTRPQRGLLLLAVLVPFHGLLLLVDVPRLVLGWKEGLTLAIVAATLVAPPEARARGGASLPGWVPAVAGLVGLALAWSAFLPAPRVLWGLKIGFFYVLVAVAVWRCPLDGRERDRLVGIFMGTGVVVALVGIVQQLLGAERLVELGYEWNVTVRTAGGLLRAFSTFNQPFPFGFYLTAVILVGLAVAIGDPARPRNRWFLLSMPVLLLGLATSLVRTAWIALAVGLLFLALHRYRGITPWLGLGTIALLATFLLLPTPALDAATSPTSFGERTAAWAGRIDVVASRPLGIGIGATGSAADQAAMAAGGEEMMALPVEAPGVFQPDNHYYKILIELGVFGLWLFVLLLVAAFGSAVATSRRVQGPDRHLAAGIGASILAVASAATASTYFEIFPLDVVFWLLLGVLSSIDRESP